ncbi:MAG: sporulation protein YtfJ [Clostridia bacterium]|nr:sporulation protein YtfJ [Clostridia bacterium]
MNEHPIEGLMITAMNSIQDMVDVNTIIGEPIETSNNVVIIPISKVCFGFAAGGSEFRGETIDEYTKKDKDEQIQYRLPFGGGAGAGVNIMPVAFLIVQPSGVKLLPVDHDSCLDKLLDYMPDLVEKANNLINKSIQNKKEEKNKTRQEEIRQKKEEQKTKQELKEKVKEEYSHVVQKTIPRKQREPKNIVYEYEYEEPVEDAKEEIVFDEADKYDD